MNRAIGRRLHMGCGESLLRSNVRNPLRQRDRINASMQMISRLNSKRARGGKSR